MDFVLSAAKKAAESAKTSAKHAIEIASMANTAARSLEDHGYVTAAMNKAAAAIHEFQSSKTLHDVAKAAASDGQEDHAMDTALASINASTNVASLAHATALDAANAGAPKKIVDMVTSHATDAHVNGTSDYMKIEDHISS
jgi:hypothetical protein